MAKANQIGDRYFAPFPKNLRKLMNGESKNEHRKTTQSELSQITGKSRQTVSQYVNGISEPGYDTLVKIADYFDCSVDYLLGRTADPRRISSGIDELGITDEVAGRFIQAKNQSTADNPISEKINWALNCDDVWTLLLRIFDCVTATTVDAVYEEITTESSDPEYIVEQLTKIATAYKGEDADLHEFFNQKAICVKMGTDEEFFFNTISHRAIKQLSFAIAEIVDRVLLDNQDVEYRNKAHIEEELRWQAFRNAGTKTAD